MTKVEFLAVPREELERVYDLLYGFYEEDVSYGEDNAITNLSAELAECVAILNQRLKHKSNNN